MQNSAMSQKFKFYYFLGQMLFLFSTEECHLFTDFLQVIKIQEIHINTLGITTF